MHIKVSTGVGEGPTPLAAFDAALANAGVLNYNLIHLSSVIPPNTVVERAQFIAPPDEYGHRLYVVMATRGAQQPGQQAWAGLGWTQEPADGRGLFVEMLGESREEVQCDIDATLKAMMASRRRDYGAIESEIVGVECEGKPVCALVIAVYKSEGWD